MDVVDTDPGAADDLEIGRRVEDVLRDLGRRTDREAIILADDRLQLFGGLAGDLVDLDAACTKDLGGIGTHFVGNENFWHADVSLFSSSPTRKRGPSSCRLQIGSASCMERVCQYV